MLRTLMRFFSRRASPKSAASANGSIPAPSAPCWRRIVRGDVAVQTGHAAMRMLLRNNVLYVTRAEQARQETVIRERIRITHGFVRHNWLALTEEIRILNRLNAEISR